MYELKQRLRWWFNHHWWPTQIKTLTGERNDWERWCLQAEKALKKCRIAFRALNTEDTTEKGD